MKYKQVYSNLLTSLKKLINKLTRKNKAELLAEINDMLASYTKYNQYGLVFAQVTREKNEEKLKQLINELYEQSVDNEIKCRVVFGDDLVDKIFEYKDHSWERIYKLKEQSNVPKI